MKSLLVPSNISEQTEIVNKKKAMLIMIINVPNMSYMSLYGV